jgi:hypothetical protein
MANVTHGCTWVIGTAVSIWLGVAGTAQARVFLLADLDHPGQQIAVELKGCISEARLEKLLPLLKHRQPTDLSPSIRVAMASPVRQPRLPLPLMVGVGF